MKKLEFLSLLRSRLSCLPPEEREERLAFYNEMIDDRVEDGLSEDEAVAQIGTVDELAARIMAETPLAGPVKEKTKPKKQRKVWQTVLLAVGSPLWLSLLIAAFTVLIAVYAALWAVVISLWAVFASVVGCALGGLAGGIILACKGNGFSGLSMIAAAILCAGLSVYLFFGCKAATKGILFLTKKSALAIKHCFVTKEVAS